MNLLEFVDVSYTYHNDQNTIPILENISLTIEEGEFIAILGPSGCGKTSLLKLASGILFPSKGKVLFRNKEIQGIDSQIGMMFQDSTLFPWLSVEQNIEFGLKMQGLKRKDREEQLKKFIKEVELEGFEKYPSYQLSGGMKQRVALARTLITHPEIILMDEPFASLDTFTKRKMQQMLLDIWQKNRQTVLFVTHDIEEAIKLGTRIVVLSKRPASIIKQFIKKDNYNLTVEDIFPLLAE